MAIDSFTNNRDPAYPGLPRLNAIPSNILTQNLMSKTSVAAECFVNQRFSNKLQAYMIDYINKIYSNYSVYH